MFGLVFNKALLCTRPQLSVCLSVRPSVHLAVRLPVVCLDITGERKGPRKSKIGRMEDHHTGIQ